MNSALLQSFDFICVHISLIYGEWVSSFVAKLFANDPHKRVCGFRETCEIRSKPQKPYNTVENQKKHQFFLCKCAIWVQARMGNYHIAGACEREKER